MIKTKKQFLGIHCHDFDRWSIVATEDCWKIIEIEEDCWNTINMDHIQTCTSQAQKFYWLWNWLHV